MKIALLHLDLSGGPQMKNLDKLCQAITVAAEGGANWIVTPETAVQGYFFALNGPSAPISVQPAPEIEPICQLARQYRLTVFLGCAEQDAESLEMYNSCLVIGDQGDCIGRHRKLRNHGDAEQWAAKGSLLTPVACRQLRAGILICADSWYVSNAVVLQEQGAGVIIVPAAWPPGQWGPGDCWNECSRQTGLPVWVCNQTGNYQADFSQAESVVIVNGGKALFYQGLPAVLLFEWDIRERNLLSTEFTIVKMAAE